ncbi:hypothetical protein DRE_06764 [Drechslerella stenobrocha 248]|uniref:Mitotic checkpoint regulator, MAD2B-interacting-domain-containing protein n=1 Tax=Drechslerella stenobrocha 248 TaxID=1043628 RepID=W7HKH6_9PEZI|nr:hypothetical protein DRE_06764 [Drechslerella stenobrocha 248]
MALVSYSDSDASDSEPAAPAITSKPRSSLAGILPPPSKKRKLVADDRAGSTASSGGAAKPSGPRKIKVELPKVSLEDDDSSSSAPTSSRSKAAGKSSGGMLSFLPAPKRTGAEAVKAKVEYAGTGMDTGIPTVDDPVADPPSQASAKPSGPVQGRVIQPFFRKSAAAGKKTSKSTGLSKLPDKEKKVSLFSLGAALNEKPLPTTSTTGEYKPMLIDDTPAPPVEDEDSYPADAPVEEAHITPPQSHDASGYGPQTFQSIGEQVGMDDAAMRMFMGRRGRNAEIKLMDFNVDDEYEKNEAARAEGALAPEKNVVRSIKPGKHQLTSLLNAAQSQRAALEESFAQGRRNKKEAGSKYGW